MALAKPIAREKQKRLLSVVAEEIEGSWKNVYFGAKPYLEAMHQMTYVVDGFDQDDGCSVILYFLSNARTWKGDDAARIKRELKSYIGQ